MNCIGTVVWEVERTIGEDVARRTADCLGGKKEQWRESTGEREEKGDLIVFPISFQLHSVALHVRDWGCAVDLRLTLPLFRKSIGKLIYSRSVIVFLINTRP